ncbi:MAG: hypothetical protein HY903_01285 [Deltaproteobacteria bacterium]|nr:hypothetical protein [Deltaproteobacteria bacterium]
MTGDKPKLKAGTNPLADVDDGLTKGYQRPSKDLIYESIMRGGGEPFGQPYDAGVSSLTDKIVKLFKQKSFFGFETFEKPRRRRRKNKFTRYGAAPFTGRYGKKT